MYFTLVNDIKQQVIVYKYTDNINILEKFNNLEKICEQNDWDFYTDRFRLLNQHGATMYIYIYNIKLNQGYWLNNLKNLKGYETILSYNN